MFDLILINLNNVIKFKDNLINISINLLLNISKRKIKSVITVHHNQILKIFPCIIRHQLTRLVSLRSTLLKVMKLLCVIIIHHFRFFGVEFLARAQSDQL